MIDIDKNTREVIRIQETEYKGHDLVDIRVFYRDTDEELKPTKKGITFKRELLDEILKALNELKESITEKSEAVK